MGRSKLKKRQLKWRILKNVAGVLAISMVLSTIVGFFYFNGVVRRQKISDEQFKLQQATNQIAFMTEDINNFAKSIVVDETLQETLTEDTFENEFERVRNKDTVTKRLVFYNSMRTYIASSFLKMADGAQHSSYTANFDPIYVERKFHVLEILQYEKESSWVYSQPYYGVDTGNQQQVVCYRTQMWDKYEFGKPQGTLYLEIYLDYFLKQIESYGSEYDQVCLLGSDGNPLYLQDKGDNIKAYLDSGKDLSKSGVYDTKEGYLICENINNTGWRLCVLITNQYIWSRSSFVLQFFAGSFLLSLLLILYFTSRVLENMVRPITDLAVQMSQTEYEHMPQIKKVRTGDEIEDLYEQYEKMLMELKQGMDERLRYEKQKKDMQFDIMLSQIHPHYLYNVLNTVTYLAASEKNLKIVKIVNALLYTLQETLKIGEHNIETTIEKELLLTDSYLTIQEYRYPQMFRLHIQCPDALKQCLVPKTIIQPVVENAILHGILPQGYGGDINLTIMAEEEDLYIIVENDGIEIEPAILKKFESREDIADKEDGRKHIGIANVRDRIRYLYGEGYDMKIERRFGNGTKVTMHLPKHWKDEIKV